MNQPQIVISPKNTGIALLLTLLFGPLGMLYATIPGAIVMGILSFIAVFLTAGLGLIITWPICIIWTIVSVSSYNKNLMAKN
jgi:hypothetical protein